MEVTVAGKNYVCVAAEQGKEIYVQVSTLLSSPLVTLSHSGPKPVTLPAFAAWPARVRSAPRRLYQSLPIDTSFVVLGVRVCRMGIRGWCSASVATTSQEVSSRWHTTTTPSNRSLAGWLLSKWASTSMQRPPNERVQSRGRKLRPRVSASAPN